MNETLFDDHPFVRPLTAVQRRSLLPCTRAVEFAEGAVVFRDGGQADTLYLLQTGCVALEQHVPGRGVLRLESLCAGDILGLSWLAPARHWTLDARCMEPVRAIAIDAACLRARMDADTALAAAILTGMVQALHQRLIRVRLQRLDVYGREA